jgi:hypothetical protein
MFAKPNWGDLCVFLPGIGLLHDEIVIGTGPDSKGGDTVVRKTAVVSTMSLYLSPETVWANRRFFQTEPQKPACCFLTTGANRPTLGPRASAVRQQQAKRIFPPPQSIVRCVYTCSGQHQCKNG